MPLLLRLAERHTDERGVRVDVDRVHRRAKQQFCLPLHEDWSCTVRSSSQRHGRGQ